MFVVALIVVAMVLSTVACSSSSASNDVAASAGDAEELSAGLYSQRMSDICIATNTELDALPTPPGEIGVVDWTAEVARLLGEEAMAFDEIQVGDDLRTDHASLVENTDDQAAQWAVLNEALTQPEAAGAGELIATARDEIAELSLGRNDLAVEMGLDGCQARPIS
ncbi:MAG: hypothetical protein ACJAR2_000463 [Ilumatobacter sp.]|jgi:hypothetical protein